MENEELLKGIGKRIEQLRKKQNMTQRQLSDAVGEPANFVKQIESGNSFTDAETFAELAKYLNTDKN